jgi:ABC-type glycerol-3-phosphate transport system substrate-binding protein
MSLYSRRRFLTTTAGAAGALAVAGALGAPARAQDRRIRHFWWGNPERDKRTFAVIDIFNSKNPGIVVEGETLGAAMYPNTPEMIPGSIVQPSQFVCLTRDSTDPEAATTYMSAFVNDLDMTRVLGLERGIPSQPDVRAALQPDLTDIERVSVEFFDGIQGKTAVPPPPPPSGANEVEQTFERLAVEALLGGRSPSEVAADFLQQAKDIIARA